MNRSRRGNEALTHPQRTPQAGFADWTKEIQMARPSVRGYGGVPGKLDLTVPLKRGAE
jgi:hypothetical protein